METKSNQNDNFDGRFKRVLDFKKTLTMNTGTLGRCPLRIIWICFGINNFSHYQYPTNRADKRIRYYR